KQSGRAREAKKSLRTLSTHALPTPRGHKNGEGFHIVRLPDGRQTQGYPVLSRSSNARGKASRAARRRRTRDEIDPHWCIRSRSRGHLDAKSFVRRPDVLERSAGFGEAVAQGVPRVLGLDEAAREPAFPLLVQPPQRLLERRELAGEDVARGRGPEPEAQAVDREHVGKGEGIRDHDDAFAVALAVHLGR